MKIKKVLLTNLVIAFIMTACGGNNPSDWDDALLTIKFIGNVGSELDCKVDISGPTPLSLEAKSGDIIQTKVAVGDYNITVKAFSGATEYANGNEKIKVVAGNNYANIVLNRIGSVATPRVNLPEGTYAKPQTIILETDTDGAIIYYTLDGSDPKTSPTHKEYTGEFILDNGTVTLKVIAVDDKGGLFDSLIFEADYTINPADAASSEKTITEFSFPTIPSAVIIINEGAKTINVTVPYGTDVTSLIPMITHTGVSYSPTAVQNFSTSKIYTITAEDGSTAIYTATVNITPPSSKKAITEFSFPTIPSAVVDINESAKTINVTVPYGSDITSLMPAITHTGVSYSPTAAQNFSTSKTYAVTAEDGSNAIYTVVVNIAAAAPSIATASLPGGVGGEAYSQTLTATGTTPITWIIDSGNLPDGLSLNSTNGTISGDPTVADTFNFTVKAENIAGSDTKPFSIVIAPGGEVATPTANLPAGMVVSGKTVELTTTTIGADIWYTTNGATPAEGTGTKYTTPITIDAAMTIKAIAVKAGMTDSAMLEAVYTITIIDTVWIPAGTFWMGSSDGSGTPGNPSPAEGYSNEERPRHEVTLTGFYMGKYQVTQEQYFAVMKTNPSSFSSSPATGEIQGKRPVENVSWYDVLVFCNKLSEKEGLTPAYRINSSTDPDDWGAVPTSSNGIWDAVEIVSGSIGYRLPTEAQWEYACRAGTTTAWFHGDAEAGLENYAWYDINSNYMTHQVGLKTDNAFGLYDMHGNVYEWCWDRYGSYPSTAQTDPEGAVSGSSRVLRGGGWAYDASLLRSAYRNNYGPSYRSRGIGLRVARP